MADELSLLLIGQFIKN